MPEQEFFQFQYLGGPSAPRRPTWHDAAKDAVSEQAAEWTGSGQREVRMLDKEHTIVHVRPGFAPVVALADPSVAMRDRLIDSLPGKATKREPAPVLAFRMPLKTAQNEAGARFSGISVPSYAQRAGETMAARERVMLQMKITAEQMLALYLQKHPEADLTMVQIVTRTDPDTKSIRMYLEPKT